MIEYKFINFFRALASFWVLITHCMIWGGGMDYHGFFISLSGWIIFKIDFLQETSLFIHTLFMWFFVGVLTYLVAYVIFIHIETRGILLGKKVANYIVPGILEGRKVNNVD